jgi:hypothetical protein
MKANRERGSVLIEVVVAIPLLVLCTLMIVQGVVVTSGLGSLEVAAKDAARAAADSCSTLSPGTAARRVAAATVEVREVRVSRSGDVYAARVEGALRLDVVHLGDVRIEVAREASMPRLDSCR